MVDNKKQNNGQKRASESCKMREKQDPPLVTQVLRKELPNDSELITYTRHV